MSTTYSNHKVYGRSSDKGAGDYHMNCELWMATHDINILSVCPHPKRDAVLYVYEFGYIVDNTKKWAKNVYYGAGNIYRDLADICNIVSFVRVDMDGE